MAISRTSQCFSSRRKLSVPRSTSKSARWVTSATSVVSDAANSGTLPGASSAGSVSSVNRAA